MVKRAGGPYDWVGTPSTLRISSSAARPTSSCSGVGSRVPTTRWISWPGTAQRAGHAGLGVALAPGEDLHGHGRAAQAHHRLGRRSAQSCLAHPHAAERRHRQHGRHQVGAAAIVLLVGVRGVGAVLVGGDRLVLDAVVGGQIAAAQGHQRRSERQQRDRRLAPDGAGARGADGLAAKGRGAHGAERAGVLHRQAGLGQGALDERDHGEGLGQLGQPAQAGNPLRRLPAEVRLGPGGHLHRPGLRAHRGGPVRGPVHQQPVAQGHAPQPQLVLGHGGGHRSVSTARSA